MLPRPARPTLFPYTTLFRSVRSSNLRAPEVQMSDRDDFSHDHFEPTQPIDLEKTRGPLGRSEPTRPVDLADADFSRDHLDRKSTRLNSSHLGISYAVFCLKK